ncbi:MAG: hypothetical protein LQ338_005536 [Usnochroma carphineum]|nr:MAG: hypothetical protein LQ338_005536 [Usnochroma carphineum]
MGGGTPAEPSSPKSKELEAEHQSVSSQQTRTGGSLYSSPPSGYGNNIDEDEGPASRSARAIESLQPGGRLTTTCIQLVLDAFDPERFRIVDHAYIDCRNPRPRPALRASSQSNMLAPIHLEDARGHWTLATIQSGTACFYDSALAPAHEKRARKALNVFYQSQQQPKASSSSSQLAFKVHDCPQQNNDFDCGVFILVAALHIVADRPFPDCIDGSTWRFIFRAALDVLGTGGVSDTNVCCKDGGLAASNRTEIARRQHFQSYLRQRLDGLQRKLTNLEDKVKEIQNVSTTLNTLQERRKEIHDDLTTELAEWDTDCEHLAYMESDATLHLKRSRTTVEEYLQRALDRARRSRAAVSTKIEKSAPKELSIARAVVCASTLYEQYQGRLEDVQAEQKEVLLAIIAIDLHEGQARAERHTWLRELRGKHEADGEVVKRNDQINHTENLDEAQASL